MLWVVAAAKSYTTGEWATYKQWAELGANVREGEKGTPIIYASTANKDHQKDNQEGDEKKSYFFMKTSVVFNADQVDNYTPETVDDKTKWNQEWAETLLNHHKPNIRFGGDQAYYSPSSDHIQMPHQSQFTDSKAFYAVQFHELAHWTGKEGRCGRPLNTNFGGNEYAFEELVAELSSAYLMAEAGLSAKPREDHAIYLKSWLKGLKEDSSAFIRAAQLATEATKYLVDPIKKDIDNTSKNIEDLQENLIAA